MDVKADGTSGSCAAGSNEISVSGLSDSLARDIYIAVEDSEDATSNIIKMDISAYDRSAHGEFLRHDML